MDSQKPDYSEFEILSLTCPITLSLMVDPVICTADGITYEREAIESWLRNNKTSPTTNLVIPPNAMLIPNHALRGAIEEVGRENDSEKRRRTVSKEKAMDALKGSHVTPVVELGADGLLSVTSDAKTQSIGEENTTNAPTRSAASMTASNRFRTFDNVLLGGSDPHPTGTVGTPGYIESINPYPESLGSTNQDSGKSIPAKVMCMASAGKFPGLVATGGHESKARIWIRRGAEEKLVEKEGKAEKKKKKSISHMFFGGEEKEPEIKEGKWEAVVELSGSKDWLNCLDMTDGGEYVLAGSRAGGVHMWKAPMMGPLNGSWREAINIKKAHDGDEFNAGVINCCMLHESGNSFITGGSDWDIKIWDSERAGSEGKEYRGVKYGNENTQSDDNALTTTFKHSSQVRDVSFSPSSNIFASSGDDGRVFAWDARVREAGVGPIAEINVGDAPVRRCTFEYGSGTWISTVSDDGRVCIYDIRKWELARVLYDKSKNPRFANNKWEGSNTIIDKFVDLKVSSEGWLAAVTEKGGLFTWDPMKEWEMMKQPATAIRVVSCLDIVRF